MSNSLVLGAISEALRTGFRGSYGDDIAAELGLSLDRWCVSRYAGNPAVAAHAMADYLDRLAHRLGDERVQVLLAELSCVHESLAEQGQQLGAAVADERFLVGDQVKNPTGGVDVV